MHRGQLKQPVRYWSPSRQWTGEPARLRDGGINADSVGLVAGLGSVWLPETPGGLHRADGRPGRRPHSRGDLGTCGHHPATPITQGPG